MHVIRVMTIFITLFFMAFELRADEYSLEDLYRIAIESSEKIKVSEENLLIAKLTKDKAMSVLIPKFSTFGNYTQYTESKKTSVGSILQPDNSSSAGLRIDQTFSVIGKEFMALEMAKENIEKNNYDLMTAKEDYLFAIANAFYNILKAKQGLEIADSNLIRLKKYEDAARKRLQVGEATKTALLRAQGELSGALSEQIKAKNAQDLAKVVLARLAGIDKNLNIKDKNIENIDPISLSQYQKEACNNRYEMKSLEWQKKIAEKQVEYSKGAYYPNISIAGIYSKLDQFPKASSGYNDESISGSITLNFPFYEGGLRNAELRESVSKKRQVELLYMDQEKSIKVEVETAYLDLMTQKGTLKFLEDQLIFATDNYFAVSKQYEAGLSNSIDIIDANNLLLTSQMKLSDAKYNYMLSAVKLKKATGCLLKELDKKS